MSEPPEEHEPIVHQEELSAIVSTSAVTADLSVKRGLNDTRLVFGILLGIGLAVGFGVPGPF